MVNIHRDEVTQPASISDAICGLCKFKNLLNLNFTDKIMMIMMIMSLRRIIVLVQFSEVNIMNYKITD